MEIVENPSLKAFNTFGTKARAALAFTIESEEDVLALPGFDPGADLVLGGGSNVLFVSDVPGNVFLNRIPGIEIIEDSGDEVVIESGAGENWHRVVRWSLDQGLCGLENLSLIPGLAGAAPIQNIGAYGVELSSVLERVTGWDWKRACWSSYSREECKLGYRDSRFKSGHPGDFLITSIRLRLSRVLQPALSYSGLRDELTSAGVRRPDARAISDAVIRIRRARLPNPGDAGNAGSFFKNPVLPKAKAEQLINEYPAIPHWDTTDDQLKLSAAWMIEHCGLKGYRKGDAAVSGQHALVLENHGSATGREILQIANTVRTRVEDEFGLVLETEPRLVDFNY